jgi:predicted O-linked N-acetylglucosamine transferase (SPINDLY family)
MNMIDFLLDQAMMLHRQGKLADAENAYRRILDQTPGQLDALQLLGVIEYQKGNFREAVGLLERAAGLAPREAGILNNLGLAMLALDRAAEALGHLDRALAAKSNFPEALNNRGNALRALGRHEEAAASYRRAIRCRPDFAEALHNLGVALLELQRPRDALETLDRALALVPNNGEAHYWRGNALLTLDRSEEALATYRHALRLRPDIPEAHYNLGNLLLDLGRPAEALAAFDAALRLRPGYIEALYNRGGALQDLRRHEEAAATYARLLEQVPAHRYALGKLFHSRQFVCDWTRYAEDVRRLEDSVRNGPSQDMPFPFLAVTDDPALQLQCARAYTTARYPPLSAAPHPESGGGDERIRIAYLSADFRDHALSYLMAGVFEAHDRRRFEMHAVSLRPPDDSATGRRVAAAFEHFHDASRLTDAEAAGLIRQLGIDIAIDLTGYTENNRTNILAGRPAPVQVNYLGFPATMGADYIDYILADAFVIPEAMRPHHAEKVVWLPGCFQANDDRRAVAQPVPTRAEAGLPASGFVFCAFNNLHKFTPRLFEIWMRLLARVPDSVLWIAAEDATAQCNLRAEAARRGVDAQRLVFAPRLPYAEHLARFALADLFLDTLPFNAGTTASDALWAGVPVLTCAGAAFAARMAGSLLHAAGLPELVTQTLEDYEALALDLASRPERLAALRARLGGDRRTLPLFDTARFTRQLEAAYAAMHARRRAGLPPQHLGSDNLEETA